MWWQRIVGNMHGIRYFLLFWLYHLRVLTYNDALITSSHVILVRICNIKSTAKTIILLPKLKLWCTNGFISVKWIKWNACIYNIRLHSSGLSFCRRYRCPIQTLRAEITLGNKGKVTVSSPHPCKINVLNPHPAFTVHIRLDIHLNNTAAHTQLGATAYKSAITGTHFLLGREKQYSVKCLAQGHNEQSHRQGIEPGTWPRS